MHTWLLVIYLAQGVIAVPNLPSKEECFRLGKRTLLVTPAPYKDDPILCIEYQSAVGGKQ